eukprot:m.59849 g.59849  ORF g.59849 m.59849 type:complete len:401 (-) comp16036_c0_seq1:81-1283(-)
MKFYCCPSFEITWRVPTWFTAPCDPNETFEQEFGLRKKDARKDAASQCMQISASALLIVALALALLVLTREYLSTLLNWLANLPGWQGPLVYGSLFIIVSLPMAFGYLLLNMGAGYIYGMYLGVLVTACGAAVGSFISFLVCRLLWKDWVTSKLSSYENLKQIIRVIEGRQGFKIVMMTRLTPVPFGLQNALFSVARISNTRYFLATVSGLLPTQILNTYMGTTLRSMEDVLSGKNSNTMVLVSQVLVAIAVTYIINQRMQREVQHACEEEAQLTRAAQLEELDRLTVQTGAGTPTKAQRTLSVQDFSTLEIPEEFTTDDEGAEEVFGSTPLLAVPAPEPPTGISVLPGETSLLSPLRKDSPATAGGTFVRGHRRSHSAGPVFSEARRDLVIKLGVVHQA